MKAQQQQEDGKRRLCQSMKRTYAMFSAGGGKDAGNSCFNSARPVPAFPASQKLKIAVKMASEYTGLEHSGGKRSHGQAKVGAGAGLGQAVNVEQPQQQQQQQQQQQEEDERTATLDTSNVTAVIQRITEEKQEQKVADVISGRRGGASLSDQQQSGALVLATNKTATQNSIVKAGSVSTTTGAALVLATKGPTKVPAPDWHAPWKLQSVVSGHLGWVRAIAFDAGNEWFVTGAGDRTIKVWDFAKCCAGAEGGLKLTLTGHVNSVRALQVSDRHPYLFSAGEDKKIMCWDLEYNKVIRNYHGHLSGIFALSLHPTLDVLVSGGRDAVARVWDMRTRKQVHCLGGHTNAVGAIATNAVDPQIITGSYDAQIKLWDLVAGKALTTLTHHKKAVRDLKMHPREFTFVSASAFNLKKWQARDGVFLHNLSGHNSVINTLSINEDNVLFSGGDDGSMTLWDYKTGHAFQKMDTIVQPGSLDSEAGIYASSFDKSGSRLITCEADKTIKIWREDVNATPESHPVDLNAWKAAYLGRKR